MTMNRCKTRYDGNRPGRLAHGKSRTARRLIRHAYIVYLP
jgi:hypothetical protein